MCDKFPRKFDVQTSYKPSKPYHTIDSSTEKLYCLNRAPFIQVWTFLTLQNVLDTLGSLRVALLVFVSHVLCRLPFRPRICSCVEFDSVFSLSSRFRFLVVVLSTRTVKENLHGPNRPPADSVSAH